LTKTTLQRTARYALEVNRSSITRLQGAQCIDVLGEVHLPALGEYLVRLLRREFADGKGHC